MQYIILDMEWNQPLNFQSQTYKRYGDRMLFELIQIGAVRVSENLDIQTGSGNMKLFDTRLASKKPSTSTTTAKMIFGKLSSSLSQSAHSFHSDAKFRTASSGFTNCPSSFSSGFVVLDASSPISSKRSMRIRHLP